MNLACAGPLLGIWLGRRRDGNPVRNEVGVRDEVGKSLAWLSVWALLVGILTGTVLLYFSPTAGLLAAVERLPSQALWFVGAELVFSFVCMLLYARSWQSPHSRRHRWWHAVWRTTLALASSSNLLYHFPPLMSVLGKLAQDPTWAKPDVLDRAALLPLMVRSEVLALTTHFALASLAVAAITILWLVSKTNRDDWKESALSFSRRSAWIALFVTLLQLPVGGWLLVSLPQSSRATMMGSSVIASLAFLTALLLTFLLLQRLLAIAIGDTQPLELRQACWLLAALVLLMTVALCESRGGSSGKEVSTSIEKS